MKFPNGYGGIVKLSGNRRCPYAVRISYIEDKDGVVKRKRKILATFARKDAALRYLADYNSGHIVPELVPYADTPTFAELYEKWKKYRQSLKDKLSEDSLKNYGIAFDHYSDLHHRKVNSIRAGDVQNCLNQWNHKSRSTIGNMRGLIKSMWSYAMMQEYVKDDITQHLRYEWTDSTTSAHTRFSDDEIASLWKNLYVINNVDIILIYIYTGMRPSELLEVLTENVHLDERYMVGGLKTEAGYNRIIPICDKILPLIQNRFSPTKKHLINNKYGNHYTYGTYVNGNWSTCMKKLHMKHSAHDCRYTFASLADNVGMNPVCTKIIMGHAITDEDRTNFKTSHGSDITKGIYTQKTLPELLAEVNKL